jgi:hypothetical protein
MLVRLALVPIAEVVEATVTGKAAALVVEADREDTKSSGRPPAWFSHMALMLSI